MKYVVTSIVSLWVLVGCGGQSKSTDENLENGDSIRGYSLDFEDVMEFVRGVESSYDLSGRWLDGQQSKITIDGLPKDASYEDGILRWKPSCSLKPENGQFIRNFIVFRTRISLSNTSESSLVQKPALLVVYLQGEDSECED